VATTDSAGSVTWRAQMQPFGLGESGSPSGAEDRPLRFVDRPIEAIGDETIADGGGLYQLGARFYDPLAGRFMGIDPLALTDVPLEEPQRFNRFAYALNNPYRYVDTSGADAEDARKFLLELAKSLPEKFHDPVFKGSMTPVRELPDSRSALIEEGAAVAKITREGFMNWLRNAWTQGNIKTLQSAPRSTTNFKPPGLIGIGITLILSAPSIAQAAESSSEGRYGSTLAVGYEYLRGSIALANPMEYEIWLNKLSYSLTEALYGLFGAEEYLPPRQKTAWEQSNENIQDLFDALDQWLASD
jgi:RHS repeat-associated protein